MENANGQIDGQYQWAKGSGNGQRLAEGKHLEEVVLHVVTHGLAPGLLGCLPLCFSTLSLLCQLNLLSSVRCITYVSLSASLTDISEKLVRWRCPAISNQSLPLCQPKCTTCYALGSRQNGWHNTA